ncbi:MAG TPA: hypothetical protein VF777_05085 [Phycisphaerales bacterium]
MRSRRVFMLDVLLLGAVGLGVVACVWSSWNWHRARGVAITCAERLAEMQALVAALEQARDRPQILADAPPATDQLTLVKDTLGEAGVPESVLRRVFSEADGVSERIEGVTLPIRRSGLRVELDGVTLPEFGRFLAAWRTRQARWTPVLLNLSPRMEPPGDAAASVGTGEPRWTVSMSAASLYLAQEERTNAGATPQPWIGGRAELVRYTGMPADTTFAEFGGFIGEGRGVQKKEMR